MSPRRTHTPASLLLLVLFLTLAALIVSASPTLAQDATPTAAQTAPAPTPGTPGTPTPTPTATLTPTPTPTLTETEARLVLAQTYLAGKDYEQAALLFAQVAEEERGNAEALAGLEAALEGKASTMATVMAPLPTPAPTAIPPVEKPTLADATAAKLRDYAGAALAALAVIVAVYFLSRLVRWLLASLRELWYTVILPLLRRPAVRPGYLIGDFANAMGASGAVAAVLVPQALAEKLLAWNQLVQSKLVPIEPEPVLDLGGMGWLKVLWSWILPAPRGYRVSGTLMQASDGAYQLVVQRTALASNSIDRGTTFERQGVSAEAAFRLLAGEAAKWLVAPADIEAGEAVSATMRAKGPGGVTLTAGEIFDEALTLLLPLRQQVNQGAIDFAEGRKRLKEAESLLGQLPDGSAIRKDLEVVIADLRRAVPGGAASGG